MRLTVEEPLEPDLPICDPHHHLWERRDRRASRPRYLLDEILEDVRGGHHIVSTVFIECGAMCKTDGPEKLRPVGETEFVNGIAAMSASGLYGKTRVAAGIVGTADLRLGDGGGRRCSTRRSPPAAAGSAASAWARPGTPTRRCPTTAPVPRRGMFLQDDFRAGFALLAPRRLTFEAWCYHRQIPDVTALARAFPDTTIILDHFGGPVGIGLLRRSGARGLRGVARPRQRARHLPERGGQAGRDQHGAQRLRLAGAAPPPGSQELADATRPYYEHTIEKFGPDRCMFESNFPVDAVSCSYTVLWNSFKRLTSKYSAGEKAKLFHDTAARVYRLTG